MKLRDQLEDLEHLAAQDKPNEKMPPISQLVSYWPFLRAALKLIKVFTGPKGDKKIDEIILWGDGLSIIGSLPHK